MRGYDHGDSLGGPTTRSPESTPGSGVVTGWTGELSWVVPT
jgi:hypothetical protein